MSNFPLEFLNLKFRPFNYTKQTAPNTACWRGYQAIWKVIDNEIYLEIYKNARLKAKQINSSYISDFVNIQTSIKTEESKAAEIP